jgi:hypothetical protein
MFRNPSLATWISVLDGCAMRYDVKGSGEMDFIIGDDEIEGFGMNVQSEALRELVSLGTEALSRMDAIAAEEEAADEMATAQG